MHVNGRRRNRLVNKCPSGKASWWCQQPFQQPACQTARQPCFEHLNDPKQQAHRSVLEAELTNHGRPIEAGLCVPRSFGTSGTGALVTSHRLELLNRHGESSTRTGRMRSTLCSGDTQERSPERADTRNIHPSVGKVSGRWARYKQVPGLAWPGSARKLGQLSQVSVEAALDAGQFTMLMNLTIKHSNLLLRHAMSTWGCHQMPQPTTLNRWHLPH